ncbi:MAG: YbaK/EbsC family protein [Bacilli bacterium]
MSVIKVKEYLKKYNMDDRIITVPTTSATVKEAAEALGTEEARIAKTISLKQKDKYIVIVTAGDVKIDNAKYKHTFNEKAHMVSFDEVEEKIGHPVGGVCPFAVNDGVEVYLDETLKRFKTVFPACGATNNAIELTIEELEKTTNPVAWIDVGKEK